MVHVALAHLRDDRRVLRIWLVAPASRELHRAVAERHLAARVLAVCPELVPGVADPSGDSLPLVLREGDEDLGERAPGWGREVELGVQADERLAPGFEPGHQRHEVDQASREAVELGHAEGHPTC